MVETERTANPETGKKRGTRNISLDSERKGDTQKRQGRQLGRNSPQSLPKVHSYSNYTS